MIFGKHPWISRIMKIAADPHPLADIHKPHIGGLDILPKQLSSVPLETLTLNTGDTYKALP